MDWIDTFEKLVRTCHTCCLLGYFAVMATHRSIPISLKFFIKDVTVIIISKFIHTNTELHCNFQMLRSE